MKIISLPPEQKAKLLEMANKLFPEHKEISVRSQFKGRMINTVQGIEVNNGMISFPYKEMDNVDQYIARRYMHWIEFVMFELAEKIFNPNPLRCNRNLQNNFKDFYWIANLYWTNQKNEHPIDYLYSKFKLLKNGK
jgi:hypothetical protein